MIDEPEIDVNFDFRSDSAGHDPDSHSATLRAYHKRLWSKALLSGVVFELDDITPHAYLHHKSDSGEFVLSSDTIATSHPGRLRSFYDQVQPEKNEDFHRRGGTIGGRMVFPLGRNGHSSINQARGMHPRIQDRFDLTLECIRRHYLQESSPLADTLERHSDFFGLFGDFAGYVEFFLLQDLVAADYARVQFFTTFDNFTTPALPADLDAYLDYRERTLQFVEARNRRIAVAFG